MMAASDAIRALTVENVVKSYGGPTVLDGVSISIDPGKILGIIGPNGSGKTTLFSVISGAFAPSSGKIFLPAGTSPHLELPHVLLPASGEPFRFRKPSRICRSTRMCLLPSSLLRG